MVTQSRIVMSPPDYFDIEYSINPWMDMDNKVNPARAKTQWETLRDTYLHLGLEVLTIPPVKGLPDLVFTTDHGVCIGDTFYLSNFRYSERQKEQDIAIPWYKRHNIKIQSIPSLCYMEGGDVFFHHDHVIIGYGFRTSLNTKEYLSNTTHYPVLTLELVDEAFYHLDTCLLPISKDIAFYYPQAFTNEGIKSLKSHFDILIALTSHEAESFASNSVIVGNNVICQPCPSFEQKLMDLGYTPITLDMHEFNKSGGGIHCLSQVLKQN